MTREKKEELVRMLESAPEEVVDAVSRLLRAFGKSVDKERPRPVLEVCACLDYPPEDEQAARDIMSNWGEPEKIDCGWSITVTLNAGETLAGFKRTVESEFECMGIAAEVMVVEVG